MLPPDPTITSQARHPEVKLLEFYWIRISTSTKSQACSLPHIGSFVYACAYAHAHFQELTVCSLSPHDSSLHSLAHCRAMYGWGARY
jgi:hypothetical protein